MGALISVLNNNDSSLNLDVGKLYDLKVSNNSIVVKDFSADEFISLRKECISKLNSLENRYFDKSENYDLSDTQMGLSEIALKSILKANGLKLNIQLYCLALNFFNYGFYLGEIAGNKRLK